MLVARSPVILFCIPYLAFFRYIRGAQHCLVYMNALGNHYTTFIMISINAELLIERCRYCHCFFYYFRTSNYDNYDKKSQVKQWDMFRITPRPDTSIFDDLVINVLKKVIKVIVSIFLTIAIVILTMLSKSTLFLITSNIYTNVTLDCMTTSLPREVTSCRRVLPDEPLKDTFQFSQNVEVRWVWALFVVVCTPYFFTCGKSLWRVCFKKTRHIRFKILALVSTLTVESKRCSI